MRLQPPPGTTVSSHPLAYTRFQNGGFKVRGAEGVGRRQGVLPCAPSQKTFVFVFLNGMFWTFGASTQFRGNKKRHFPVDFLQGLYIQRWRAQNLYTIPALRTASARGGRISGTYWVEHLKIVLVPAHPCRLFRRREGHKTNLLHYCCHQG